MSSDPSAAEAPAVLLDTCALIWLANGDAMTRTARAAIVHAGLSHGVFVSPVSAWEVGLLAHPPAGKPALDFLPDPKTWFARVMAQPALLRAALTADIAIESSILPGEFHRDPGDRLIVATARSLNMPIVTRDRKILDYASAGYVNAIAC